MGNFGKFPRARAPHKNTLKCINILLDKWDEICYNKSVNKKGSVANGKIRFNPSALNA